MVYRGYPDWFTVYFCTLSAVLRDSMAEKYRQWKLERFQSDEEDELATELVQTAISAALAGAECHTKR